MKFDREKYLSYCFDTVKRLMDVPSPSGYSREIAALLADIASEQGLELEATKKSCFFYTYKGADSEKALGIAAHCDTLGAMVRSIDGTHPHSLLLFVHSSLFLPVVTNHRVRVFDYSVRAVVCSLAEIVTASVTGEAMLIGEVHLCPDDGLLLWLV